MFVYLLNGDVVELANVATLAMDAGALMFYRDGLEVARYLRSDIYSCSRTLSCPSPT